MKKVYLAVLTVVLMASLVIGSCGEPEETTAPTTEPTTTTPTTTTPTTTAPTTTAPTTTAPTTTAPTTTAPTVQPQYGGTLRYGTSSSPRGLGIPTEAVAGSYQFTWGCLESLFHEDANGRPLPWLCTDWELAPDLMFYTLHLKKGVKFHDGTDFNAEACKWNLEKYRDSRRSELNLIESVDVVDEYTVRLNFEVFDNTILNQLATWAGMMVSPTAFEKNGEDWALWHPVGTGPFKFASMERDVFVKYERWDGYHIEGQPYLDNFEIITIKDPLVMVAALLGGEVDVVGNISPKYLTQLEDEGIIFSSCSGSSRCLLPDSINNDSPFAKKKVREAIEYAIDSKAIADPLGYGTWTAINQIAPPGFLGHISNLKGRSYNPEYARQLLADAGYPNGFNTTLIGESDSPTGKDECTAIAGYLAAVGINAEIDLAPRARHNEMLRSTGWGPNAILYVHPMNKPNNTITITNFITAGNVDMRRTPGLMDLAIESLEASDFDTQVALTQEMVQVLSEEALVVPLWLAPSGYAFAPYVHDLGLCRAHFNEMYPGEVWLSK